MPEEELPLGATPDESILKQNTQTSAIEGFFRVPAIWVEHRPDPVSVRELNLPVHHEVALEKQLDSGITVRVQRDGTFLFDFKKWSLAPQVVIPGYKAPGQGIPHRLPAETDKVLQSAENFAINRAKVMNVLQACLATSEQLLKGREELMGIPVDAQSTLKGQTFEDAVSYNEVAADLHSLARNAANDRYTVSPNRLLSRRVVELEVVEHSLSLLDQILLDDDLALIHMVDSLYGAARRYTERRPGESVAVAWAVCEQLLSFAWNALLESANAAGRMPGKRRKKFEGRDYTASVMVEVLEITSNIDFSLYGHLEAARKSRNDWAHSLKEPNYRDVYSTFGAAQGLLRNFKGIRLRLALTDPGPGVPSWYR